MKKFVCFCFASTTLLFGELSYTFEEINEVTFAQVLRVDPKEYSLKVVRAKDHMQKTREGVACIARREGAIAAINGGFYKENGDPAGALKIDGKWVGLPAQPRGALGWDRIQKKFVIDTILTTGKDKRVKVVTQSSPKYTKSKDWNSLDYIVGGVPVLLRNGKVIEDFSSESSREKFLTEKNRRSAVGILEDGTLLFVVISSPYSKLQLKSFKASKVWEEEPGITLDALAGYMHKLGCKEALNLCGASSSAMFIDANEVDVFVDYQSTMTKPVSDVIAIFKK